jgi:hypothetical protein
MALAALTALSQTTRLQTFRLLVNREPDGVAAGELARGGLQGSSIGWASQSCPPYVKASR